MNFAKEDTYQIACSLGAASSSQVIANVDYRMIGLLPNLGAASFADACVGSFLALELERDLLKVPNLSLVDVVNFHVASVSGYVFICIHFCRLLFAIRWFHVTLSTFAGLAPSSRASASRACFSPGPGERSCGQGRKDPSPREGARGGQQIGRRECLCPQDYGGAG